jgi:hypothetical protein
MIQISIDLPRDFLIGTIWHFWERLHFDVFTDPVEQIEQARRPHDARLADGFGSGLDRFASNDHISFASKPCEAFWA